ncbi:MAG: amino acid ABC transporter permease [Anaerolineae bacterium UTCFX2]|jgi:polar amino acid transport system permease protein|nr:amino acid ABC transporter permease [Anaerolineae bacterium]MCZ7554282.1 amino acid ABC transporter permease [Anaerolineales bacterium]OQY87951.1 MAG: amino acid ABC transporter permease [Anaerolineae bacterium UTCFX2]
MSDWLDFFWRSIPVFLNGLWVTLELTAVGLIVGFGLGLAAALGRVYGSPWVRRICIAYIEIFRGTPLLVQLFLIYYGFPGIGITLSRMMSAYLTLGLNSGAYQAEYLRGAIMAVSEGQMMAGRSIGLSRLASIRYVILPQALRLVIPSWSNEPILLLKSTAVAFLIAVPDLMTKAKLIAARTYDPIGTYLAVAVVYLVIVGLLNEVMKALERRLRIPGLEIESHKP